MLYVTHGCRQRDIDAIIWLGAISHAWNIVHCVPEASVGWLGRINYQQHFRWELSKLADVRQIDSVRHQRCFLLGGHTHPRLMALCPGLPGWAGTRKVKPVWISLKQETVSGSGISWDICKSALRTRQITTPAPHHSVFYRPNALPATQPTASKHWRHGVQILRWKWWSDGASACWARLQQRADCSLSTSWPPQWRVAVLNTWAQPLRVHLTCSTQVWQSINLYLNPAAQGPSHL